MTHVLVGGLVLALAALAAGGWGRLVARAAGIAAPPAVAVALGIAAVLALGGVLNLLRLAWAPALWLVFAAGVALAWPWLRRVREVRVDRELAFAALVIAVAVGFALATQLPPAWVNHHDDMEKYFAHVERMLATGTLAGSPLSALGSETLGGLSFLQGFVRSCWPVPYVNAADAIFGLGLLLALSAGAALGRFGTAAGATLVVLTLALTDPYYVNTSALYLGAALMLAAVRVGAAEAAPLALGVVYAALVALKPTFVLFAALHGAGLAALRLATAGWRDALAWSARVAGWAALALAPWLALHAPHYLAPALPRLPVPEAAELLMSRLESLLGATARHLALFLLGVGAAIAGLVTGRAQGAALAGVAAGVVASAILVVGLNGVLSDDATHMRYAVPFLLGTVPAAVALLLPVAGDAGMTWPRAAVVIALLIVCAESLPRAASRYRMTLEVHSMLSYLSPETLRDARYAAYYHEAFSVDGHARYRTLQDKVPPGEPLLAWTPQTFQLDFARNPIIDVEPAGLASPWAWVPGDARWVLWEYAGPAVRSVMDYGLWVTNPGARERRIAASGLGFARWLEKQAAAGEVIHVDGRIVLFRLAAPPGKMTAESRINWTRE